VIRDCSGAGAPDVSPARRRLILIATVLASGMAFVDSSVVNVALPAIQRDLAASGSAAAWVMNAYLLLLAALVLAGGAAADRFGRRRVLVIGVGVFALASVGCALAPSPGALIAARAVQGAGAALLTPASLAILGASFDGEARGQAIGTWAGVGAVMAALGPVLGGWLVDALSWRAIFFINLPLALATVALALAAIPESRDPQAGGLDGLGAILAALGLGLLAWGLTSAASRGFAAPPVAGALVAGVVLSVAFAVWEARAPAPMVPPALLASRDFAGANILTLLLYFALGGALFFLPFELIRAHGYRATAAGAALTPFSVVMGLFSPLAGRMAARLGARGALSLGPAVAAAGFALLAVRAGDGSYWTGVFPGVLVLAVGMTLSVAPLTDTVMSSVAPGHAGKASGINNAAARLAGLLAVAIMSLVFAARFDRCLDARVGADAPGRPARGQALAVQPMAARGTLADAERNAFDEAYRFVMLAAAGCALAGGAAAWVMIGGRAASGGGLPSRGDDAPR
jgi:EmrB/QacA subfamily drug resistance transporter